MLEAVATARRAPTTCECGAPVPWGSHFCANCGRPVGAEPVVACEGCGHPLSADATFCAPAAGRSRRATRPSRSPSRNRRPKPRQRPKSPRSTRRSSTRPIPGRAEWPSPRTTGAARAAARRTARARSTASSAVSGCPRGRASSPASAPAGAGTGLVSRRLDLAGAARARGRGRRGRRLGGLARRRLELGQRHDRPHRGGSVGERRRRRPRPSRRPPRPTTTRPTTHRAPASAAARSPRLVAWPAGKSGWTIVLDSVPTTNGRAGAVGEAKQALRLGLKPVGVLDSSAFSSLHPGYYVVFFGIYDERARGAEPRDRSAPQRLPRAVPPADHPLTFTAKPTG